MKDQDQSIEVGFYRRDEISTNHKELPCIQSCLITLGIFLVRSSDKSSPFFSSSNAQSNRKFELTHDATKKLSISWRVTTKLSQPQEITTLYFYLSIHLVIVCFVLPKEANIVQVLVFYKWLKQEKWKLSSAFILKTSSLGVSTFTFTPNK